MFQTIEPLEHIEQTDAVPAVRQRNSDRHEQARPGATAPQSSPPPPARHPYKGQLIDLNV